MAIDRVQLLSVPVADQDRALAFYRDLLGFELRTDAALGPDMRWVLLAPPGGGAGITLVTWFESMPAGSLRGLVLETGDLDAEVGRLREAGLELGEIESAPWGRFVQFDDPDGNGLILQTTADA